MRGSRPPIAVFDYGPDIETLRENCKKETGLPAPVAPQWKTKAANDDEAYKVAAE